MPRSSSRSRVGPIRARPSNPNDSTRRTVFTDDSVAIYAWPSRGGVIILNEATHVDFVFLGLSTVNPPSKRDGGNRSVEKEPADVMQLREDAFCQRLLLLGAKWWDSEERCRFVSRVGGGDQPTIAHVEAGRVEEPTLRERRWIKVGWEGTATGATTSSMSHGENIKDSDDSSHKNGSCGLWVLDCDTNMHGILEEDNTVPVDAGRLCLAGSMKERCEILKRLGATFFHNLKEYEGDTTFLRAWEWKWDGEIGEMLKCQ